MKSVSCFILFSVTQHRALFAIQSIHLQIARKEFGAHLPFAVNATHLAKQAIHCLTCMYRNYGILTLLIFRYFRREPRRPSASCQDTVHLLNTESPSQMKPSIFKFPAALTVSSAFLLAACGCGGGDAPAASSTQAASTVTVANANDVAAQGYASSNAINNQVSGGSSLVTGVSVETKATGLIDASVKHLYRALSAKPTNMVVGVSGTLDPEPCTGGGTITVAYNVADVDTLSNGDTLTITSNNCVEGHLPHKSSCRTKTGPWFSAKVAAEFIR